MIQQVVIRASEGRRAFNQLLEQGYRSEEHIIVERDGFPVMVIMSYQEYEQLNQFQPEDMLPEDPAPINLDHTFDPVTRLDRSEDLVSLREATIEMHG